ncbi:hypothetical protein GGD68_004942 [Paraburkholderia fungorum]|jgi:hypothetical protein|uniref:Uncharacterized protein n=1 Tax=Paraburkholderia fungorum TaxID=134537 RepID=A0AAW3V1C6_9BURK|nr:hypothetical protein [Paraburkholderia fungorum]MBB5541475.1 hypothetical protein [Paraburkholderia fungorum]MBB6204752.1 hypothetical protein [Paraburkholderia fungorum]
MDRGGVMRAVRHISCLKSLIRVTRGGIVLVLFPDYHLK